MDSEEESISLSLFVKAKEKFDFLEDGKRECGLPKRKGKQKS